MKSLSLLGINIVFSVLTLAVAIALFLLARGNDPDDYRQSISGVREIQQVASDWSIETARVRSDPLADFDSLAAFIPRMDQLKDLLMTTIRGIPDVPDRLANDVSAYVNAVEAREERIERFKTGYAIIRNSARYLPLAAANIVQSESVDADLSREVAALTNDINAYLTAPTDAAKGRLTVALERLEDRADGLAAPLPDHIANFIAHADVLLAQQAPTRELFSQATSSEISDLSAQLVNDLGVQLTRKSTLSSYYMNGMLAAAGAMILLWFVSGAVRLRSAGRVAAPATAQANERVGASATDAGPPARRIRALDGDASAKVLMAHRITAECVAARLAESARGISSTLETLRDVHEDVRAGARANGTDPAHALAQGESIVDEARRQATEIADTAERLASFSRGRSDVSYALVDINECVMDVIASTDAEAVASVVTEAGAVPEVFASRAEVCLMLEKVVENSLQAIDEANREDAEIRISTTAENDRASVTIMDNGVGMTPEVRGRMFEPFYTESDQRTGVGLSSTSHLVEKYGGTISVSSMAGGGTVTRIQLPGMSGG